LDIPIPTPMVARPTGERESKRGRKFSVRWRVSHVGQASRERNSPPIHMPTLTAKALMKDPAKTKPIPTATQDLLPYLVEIQSPTNAEGTERRWEATKFNS
jgi:hypothetical protein